MKKQGRLLLFLKNKGDEYQRKELFSEIWQVYYSGLILFIRSFPRIKDEADDHAQEIFMKVFLSLDSYNLFYSFSTWFYRIARNYCIDVLRKKTTHEGKNVNIRKIEKSNQLSPEDILIQKEELYILNKFINKVSEREKQILILRYSENLKYREIAEILQLNSSTVRSIVRKLKMDCKKYLEKEYER
ncbi:MAG: sigma-70 family RNA polymerase sigma factor [Spirochaetales bacterium]|nr:sigma-70 family RNA polymerase sigma factor [Spirochaetales bacterium]